MSVKLNQKSSGTKDVVEFKIFQAQDQKTFTDGLAELVNNQGYDVGKIYETTKPYIVLLKRNRMPSE